MSKLERMEAIFRSLNLSAIVSDQQIKQMKIANCGLKGLMQKLRDLKLSNNDPMLDWCWQTVCDAGPTLD